MECVEENSNSITDLTTFIINNTLLSIIFLIGLYLHIKIIIVSNQEKDERLTWRIDICHSIVLITTCVLRILFWMVTYFIPCLHQYTGKWFCYVVWFVSGYCTISVVSHSLVISLYKYMFIVHQKRINVFGKDKASQIAFWANLVFPAVFALAFIARPNDITVPTVADCLGRQEEFAARANETFKSRMQRRTFGEFRDYDDHDGFLGQLINVVNKTGCFLTSVIWWIIMSNIMEGFVYRKIFIYMKR